MFLYKPVTMSRPPYIFLWTWIPYFLWPTSPSFLVYSRVSPKRNSQYNMFPNQECMGSSFFFLAHKYGKKITFFSPSHLRFGMPGLKFHVKSNSLRIRKALLHSPLASRMTSSYFRSFISDLFFLSENDEDFLFTPSVLEFHGCVPY